MSRLLRYAGLLLAVLLLLAFWVIWLFPAPMAWKLFAERKPDYLVIADSRLLSGTVWSGAVKNPALYGITLEKIDWQWQPWSLLNATQQLEVNLKQQRNTLSATVNLEHDNNIIVTGLAGTGSLAQLPWALPHITDGGYQAVISHLSIHNNQCGQLNGFVQLTDIKTPLWPAPFDVQAQLSCDQNTLNLTLTGAGELDLQAEGYINHNGFYMSGSLVAQTDKQAALLRFYGLRKKQGRYLFAVNSPLQLR